jgi:hypothetical protein
VRDFISVVPFFACEAPACSHAGERNRHLSSSVQQVLGHRREKIRAILAPPKLIIQSHTFRGSPTLLVPHGAIDPSGGTRAMYYHLKVANLRPWLTAKDCRVLLKGIARRRPDGSFLPVHMPVPLQFVWANEGDTPQRVVVTKESVLAFGLLSEHATRFEPQLYIYATNLDCFVAKGEAVRYLLEIDASNLISKRQQIFEVAWDGQWYFEPEQMEQHLTVREVYEP